MSIIQALKNQGLDENTIKFDTAEYYPDKGECILHFVYSPEITMTNEMRNTVHAAATQLADGICPVRVKFTKGYYDQEVLLSYIHAYFEKHYKALVCVFGENDITCTEKEGTVEVSFACDKMTAGLLEKNGFVAHMQEYLEHKFFQHFGVSIDATKSTQDYSDMLQEEVIIADSLSDILEAEAKFNTVDITEPELIVGKPIATLPVFISSVPNQDGVLVTVCGKAQRLTLSKYLRKPKEEGAEPEERTRFSFTLTDCSGSVDIVMFPNEKYVQTLGDIPEGMELVVSGTTSMFNGRFNIRAANLSRCEILTKEQTFIYRNANPKYMHVFPKPLNEKKQMDLFSLAAAEDSVIEYWKDKTFVVFDLETTGLDPASCQIIEIGAVKIQNGMCVEAFQTLVNPKTKLPTEIIELTGIDDNMLTEAPTIEQVLPDFYKFAEGCILNAYNIAFDYQFLKNIGQRLRYKFDHQQVDTLQIARSKVPSLHNYKLSTVVKALDVTLDNAHRALADALATAKVFIKLIENY